MRLASFAIGKRKTFGVLVDDWVVDLGADGKTLCEFLREGGLVKLLRNGTPKYADFPVSDITFLPLLSHPARIICAGLNYADKQKEMAKLQDGGYPSFFSRYDDSLVGHQGSLVRPKASPHFDYEGELAVVIGKRAHHVAEADTLSYIAGYTCLNDGTIRNYLSHSVFAGKNFWHSGSIGPWLATADTIQDPSKLTLRTRVNSREFQCCCINELIFGVPQLISYLSRLAPLEPGDVIATGSPAGVGARRDPPYWLKPGDVIEVEISEIGILRNDVVDEPV